MRRAPSQLIVLAGTLLASLSAISAWPATARAQAASPAKPGNGGACAPVEQELASTRRDAEVARRQATEAEERAATCAADLTTSTTRAQQATDASNQCEQRRGHLCSATAALVDELTHGRTAGASETGCVSREARQRLDSMVGGWNATTAALGQIAAYESGETDSLPRPRAGATPLESALQRLLRADGRQALHRRLLVEALKLVAPEAWSAIRTGGGASVDAWFADPSPLPAAIASEARNADAAPPGPAGPPLSAALSLVDAFRVAARCGDLNAPAVGDCRRAQQLKTLLESSGSLVMRRRTEQIWASQCTTIDPDAVAGWLRDFPTSRIEAAADPWLEISANAYAKLFACYLDNPSQHLPFGTWLKTKLPAASSLDAANLRRVDLIAGRSRDGSRHAACARAARAMQTFVLPSTCAVPAGDFRPALEAWTRVSRKLEDADVPLEMCAQFARLLWEGKAASIDGSFTRPPSLDEMVVAKPTPPTPMWRLRQHCEERRGGVGHFETDAAFLASVARAFGEGVEGAPFRIDPSSLQPVERVRFDAVQGFRPWLTHVARGTSACTTLGLGAGRCRACAQLAPDAAYDCALVSRLDNSWTARTRALVAAMAVLALAVIGGIWARSALEAYQSYSPWARDTLAFLREIGLAARRDPWRLVFPSRSDALLVTLPADRAWERWGSVAALVRAPAGPRVRERDVNHAAFVARRARASVVILEHDDDAGPDLSAVRAMLEWAAKDAARAVQILPIGVSRARWSKSAHDVLDLVEESSLRGNPFELRGRIATSAQFFNRERLVSGLLAAAHAGHWMVVTGLRRFGKSSLALEVARRVPGPSAYADLAGFDHEIAHGDDPARAADAILRFVCLRLHESARARWPDAAMPVPPPEGASLDAATLTQWLRDLSRACRAACGHSTPLLVVLDEIEQALAVGASRLAHALDVLAVVIGRLKGAVGDAATADGGAPIGVFLACALHPVLWAPLRTLAHQSIMGSFQRVCVPCLPEDAAMTMMRNLGGRQGIRFTDDALSYVVEASQGVPLLLRRLGSSILELYDTERARQGSLGAVEIGIEGAREAVAREAREGSPLRVWIETEIAAPTTVVGALLHVLAREPRVDAQALQALAKQRISAELSRTGVAETLEPNELARRSEEAAHVIVQLLEESGLVIPHGDLTAPDAYSLPEGAIRSVLQAQQGSAPDSTFSALA